MEFESRSKTLTTVEKIYYYNIKRESNKTSNIYNVHASTIDIIECLALIIFCDKIT